MSVTCPEANVPTGDLQGKRVHKTAAGFKLRGFPSAEAATHAKNGIAAIFPTATVCVSNVNAMGVRGSLEAVGKLNPSPDFVSGTTRGQCLSLYMFGTDAERAYKRLSFPKGCQIVKVEVSDLMAMSSVVFR